MTDATAVLIRHPAKEDGNPEGAQGLAQVSTQPQKVGRQEQVLQWLRTPQERVTKEPQSPETVDVCWWASTDV